VCDTEGEPCGSEDVLAYYQHCHQCSTVWLSDRSAYDRTKKRVYEEYITKLDTKLATSGIVSGYHPERMKNYRKLAERFFCLLHFLADNMGRREPGPFRFIEIGFDLPSVFSCFHEYGYDVTALDIKIPMELKRWLEEKTATGRLHLTESDFESWKTDVRFDVLWMSHVIEHFEDTVETLKKIRSLLKNTGVAFISSPDAKNFETHGPESLMGHMHPDQHLFMYSVRTFAQLCKSAGLKVCFSERYGDPIPGQFEFVTKMEWRAVVVPDDRAL
jgi:SAM-dependent methyltransferase